MADDPNTFKQLETIANEQDVPAALEWLGDHFREQGDFQQLFEARKMAVRHRLGLSLLYESQPDQLDENAQHQLEEGLLDTCREVGTLMIQQGDIRDGWLYLQPVGDRQSAEELLNNIPVTDENIETLIEVGLFEGAAPELGYQLLLQHQGTCNAITTFERDCGRLDKPTRQLLAGLLVRHLYRELVENIRGHIEKHEQKMPDSLSLVELLDGRDWLTAGGNHHIDTTHLASVTRIGQIVDHPDELKMLFEFTRYGQALDSDFHYEGEPPFEQSYVDYGIFYHALATREAAAIGDAVQHFSKKTKAIDRAQFGAIAFEVLVDLLFRAGKHQQAIDVYAEQLYGADDLSGLAPHIFELAQTATQLATTAQFFEDKNDLLGYSVSLLKAKLIV